MSNRLRRPQKDLKRMKALKMLMAKIGSEVGYSSWLLPMEPPTQDRSRISLEPR